MNVLSLFDWISCGRVALDRAWIPVDRYFSSEIDPYAIKISSANYPDIIHLWDVTDVMYHFDKLYVYGRSVWDEPRWKWKIDLLIGGPPCQDLSIAKKDRKWLEWEKSNLFFEYLRVLKEVRPRYFIMENVASMSHENKKIITDHLLEAYPDTVCHKINSNIYGAQNRKRLFWTNIQGYKEPADRGITLKDILEDIPMDDPRWKPLDKKFLTEKLKLQLREKSYAITATYSHGCPRDYFEKSNRQLIIWQFRRWDHLRIHADQENSPTLTSNMGTGGNNVPVILGIYQIPRGKNEWGIVANGEKSPTLTTSDYANNSKVLAEYELEYYWRKLTPIECERLMNLEDNYTDFVSATRRYHAIGNAFDPAIIADFLKLIK